MDVVSVCPLRVAELRWVLSNGAHALTVVCKATFVLQPGEAALAPQQDAPAADEGYWGGDGEKGAGAFSDLVPFKPRADVVITGHAHAPPGRPARILVVRAAVGAMDKAIEVHGDRFFLQSGELREGAPWVKQRLAWDRAAGGPDTANPVGMRFDAQDALGNTPLPNLQPPGSHVARRGDTFAPACFAPIPPAWPARLYKLYRHGRALMTRDWNARPLPEDIDRGFFNVAPPDQQVPELRPDERIALENLHPEHPRLVTRLPGIEPSAAVVRAGRMPTPLALTCDTLWIDADRGTCSLVWRGTVVLARPNEVGQVSISMGSAPSARAAGPGSAAQERPMTIQAMDALTAQEALPFVRTTPARVAAPPAPVVQPPAVVQRPAQGSIGERLANEQALSESPAPAPAPAPARDAGPKRAGAAAARDAAKEALVLLWLDPASVPRMRKKPAFRDILDELEEQEPDEELDASVDGALADVDDQRAVFEILAKGQAADDEGLARAMAEGLRDDGKFVPPLLLLAGELSFPFDELETLRATVITVAPLAGADEPLKAALETAQRFLATPDLSCAPAVAEGMIQRIREAWAAGKRVVPAGYLEAQTERMLLEQRRYQKRTVFGGPQLRGLLHLHGGQSPAPAYVPAQAASKLPLYQRFRVRLIATGHVAEDQNETHPTALKVLAFARVAPAPGAAFRASSSPRA